MKGTNTQLLIFQIIMMSILLIVIVRLLVVKKSLKYVNRIGSFGIDSVNANESSFFDKLFKLILKVIKCLSKVFKKSKFLVKKCHKYEKYISFDNIKSIEIIDYLSIKVFISLLFLIFYIMTSVFQYTSINLFMLIISVIFGYYIYDIVLKIGYIKYRNRIEQDLLKGIVIMNNAFQSGRNIVQAVAIVIDQVNGPIQEEFKKINMDINYGLSLDVVFTRFYERVELEDAKYMASSLALLNRTGGNIVKVFSSIEKSIFSKKRLRDEIKTMTASSIFMFRLLVSLPLILIALLTILNPDYFKPLLTSVLGILVIILTSLLFVIYVLVVKKVMEVDV